MSSVKSGSRPSSTPSPSPVQELGDTGCFGHVQFGVVGRTLASPRSSPWLRAPIGGRAVVRRSGTRYSDALATGKRQVQLVLYPIDRVEWTALAEQRAVLTERLEDGVDVLDRVIGVRRDAQVAVPL